MSKHSIFLKDEVSQQAFASQIAEQCSAGTVIFLQGELGTGKTTFARGFLQALGCKGIVKSPTYTLVEPYVLDDRRIYHFDLYRLGDPEELEYLGGRDYFDEQAICLVEWPEKAAGYLPVADIHCCFSYENEGRRLEIGSNTDKGKAMLAAISY